MEREPSKQSIRTPTGISHFHVGVCDDCKRLGDLLRPCLNCEGKIDGIIFNEINKGQVFLDLEEYKKCPKCESIFHTTEEEFCNLCKTTGDEVKLNQVVEAEDEKKIIEDMTLPPCALVNWNRCEKCYHTAHYLRSQLATDINMAIDSMSVVRAYEVTVEQGYAVNLKKKSNKRPKFTYDYSFVDISPNTLKGLIEHHDKFCLCSICKWCIIIGVI